MVIILLMQKEKKIKQKDKWRADSECPTLKQLTFNI